MSSPAHDIGGKVSKILSHFDTWFYAYTNFEFTSLYFSPLNELDQPLYCP